MTKFKRVRNAEGKMVLKLDKEASVLTKPEPSLKVRLGRTISNTTDYSLTDVEDLQDDQKIEDFSGSEKSGNFSELDSDGDNFDEPMKNVVEKTIETLVDIKGNKPTEKNVVSRKDALPERKSSIPPLLKRPDPTTHRAFSGSGEIEDFSVFKLKKINRKIDTIKSLDKKIASITPPINNNFKNFLQSIPQNPKISSNNI